VPGDVGLN